MILPYNPESKCPKCGHDKVSIKYCTKYFSDCPVLLDLHRTIKVFTEHFDRECQRCGYTWFERTLDEGASQNAQ